MKIKVAKIIRQLSLAQYAPEYAETVFDVWVNPPSDLTDKINTTIQRTSNAFEVLKTSDDETKIADARAEIEKQSLEQAGYFSQLWSQGKPETRMSVDDIKALTEDTADTDPMLYAWIMSETWRMVLEHRNLSKKK